MAQRRTARGIRSREIIRTTSRCTRARASSIKPRQPKPGNGKVCQRLSFLIRSINTERLGCACLRQQARQALRTDGDRRGIIQSRQRCSGCLPYPYPHRRGQRSVLVKRVERRSRLRTLTLLNPKPWNHRRTSRWQNPKMWRLLKFVLKHHKRRLRPPWTHSKSLKQRK